MSKYDGLGRHELNVAVANALGIDWEEGIVFQSPADPNAPDAEFSRATVKRKITNNEKFWKEFDPCRMLGDNMRTLDGLVKITGGVFLKEDGSATTEINGKQVTATGGHCRAICVLFLMAKDAQNQLQNA